MAAITGFLPELIQEITNDFYTDCGSILHALESDEDGFGRVCKEWVAVPDPCDSSRNMSHVACQFYYGEKERDEGQNLTEVKEMATVDLPFDGRWITAQMRFEFAGCVYKIKSIQPDHDFMTRLKLERTER